MNIIHTQDVKLNGMNWSPAVTHLNIYLVQLVLKNVVNVNHRMWLDMVLISVQRIQSEREREIVCV